MNEDTVKVAVRIRPLLGDEISRGCKNCLAVVPGEPQIQVVDTDKAFTYNYVFPPEVDQNDFYSTAIKGMIGNIFEGYNVTILAYGQTGSGKTHSMGTNYSGTETMGVIPRAVKDIFKIVEEGSENYEYKITVSFMELYQEQVYDLLSDKPKKETIVDIREDSKGIKIQGLTEKEVTNSKETLAALIRGSQGRATGATAMNSQSSRSHAIFTISVQQQKKNDPTSATVAKFHLVDLAGSERSKKTQATGERFKEGVNINKGLLALGNVISQLGEGNTNFIPYRDSKLTRLLQDSLGGNSVTLMIACVSPADYNADESISTLRYADRAKKIKNKPIVNQDPMITELNRLKEHNRILQAKLLQSSFDGGVANGESCPAEHKTLLETNQKLQKKIHTLNEDLRTYFCDILNMHERAEIAEKAEEQLKDNMSKITQEIQEIRKTFENYPTEYKELAESKEMWTLLEHFYNTVIAFEHEQSKKISDYMDHDNLTKSREGKNLNETFAIPKEANNSGAVELEIDELSAVHEQQENHMQLQSERNNQVQNINRELLLKENLIATLMKEHSRVQDHNKELEDMEKEIKNLQNEKDDLLKTLQNVHTTTTSAKLAETRRKKLQELEKKIAELNKKIVEQGRTIKMKEKSEQQVKNLMSEVRNLKQTRVGLIKQMRNESDKFSKWRHEKTQELYKLKNQEKKRQYEMVKMQNVHDKQQNVLKRRMEETFAINKRLKEALEVQKKANLRRDQKNTTNKETLKTLMEHDLAVVLSTAEAQCTLDRLISDKEELEKNVNLLLDTCGEEAKNSQQMEEIMDCLQVRKNQIEQLTAHLSETEQGNKENAKWQNLKSTEAAVAISYLFDSVVKMQKERSREKDQLMKQIAEYQLKLEEANKKAEQSMRKTSSVGRKTKTLGIVEEFNLDISSQSDGMEDDTSKDPDWTKTPIFKRITTQLRRRPDSKEAANTTKRSSSGDIKCGCKLDCLTNRCNCKRQDQRCVNCNCNPEKCLNKDTEMAERKQLFKDVDSADEEVETPKKIRLQLEL